MATPVQNLYRFQMSGKGTWRNVQLVHLTLWDSSGGVSLPDEVFGVHKFSSHTFGR